MKYYSTNNQSPIVNFKEATIKGQAPDKGLYFPETIPQVEKKLIDCIADFSNEEIAFQVIKPYVGNAINENDLFNIVKETINFNIPLVKVTGRSFFTEGRAPAGAIPGMSQKEFCRKFDCKQSQKVIIKFNMDDKK